MEIIMLITFPTDTKQTIDAIRKAIGRDIIFYLQTSVSGCYACSLDPVNDTSTDSFCTVCSGVYWIPTYPNEVVNAHVAWKPFDKLRWVTGGQYYDGDCLAQIEYTELNKTLTEPKTVVVIDNKQMYVETRYFRGVPEINRILIGLKEKEKDNE